MLHKKQSVDAVASLAGIYQTLLENQRICIAHLPGVL
jgi:hypothetical protein